MTDNPVEQQVLAFETVARDEDGIKKTRAVHGDAEFVAFQVCAGYWIGAVYRPAENEYPEWTGEAADRDGAQRLLEEYAQGTRT